MLDLITEIFGTYEPNTYIQYVYDEAGNVIDSFEVIASGAAGVDWSFISGVALFGIALFCIFKLFGVLLKR